MMQIEAKKNTAYYLCWPMVDSSTPANYKSGASVTVAAYYKDGAGAWTSFTPADSVAEIGTSGVYEMDLSASEMNHDKILIKLTASGAATTSFMFDTRTKLTDDLNDLAQSDILSDATPFAGANVNAAISSRSSHAAADVWSVATRTVTGGTITTNNDKTGYSITGTITTLDALNTQLGSDHGSGAWTTATGFSTHSAADIWTVATRTLTASLDPTAAQIADAVWDELRSGHTAAGSFGEGVATVQGNVTGSVASVTGSVTVGTNNDKTGYALTSAYDAAKTAAQAGDAMALTAAAVDAIWDELRSGHVAAGSFGEGVASVQGNVTGSVASVTGSVTVGTNNDKTGYSLTAAYDAAKTASQAGDSMALTAAAVDAIWDESQSGHTATGTFGYYLDARVSLSAAPWSTSLPGSYGAGTAGYILGTYLDAKVSDVPTASEIDSQLTTSHGSGAWTSGGAGSGARTVTTTVNDGTDPIEGAKVRYTLGTENYVQQTDVNGQCTHNLDDGTWTVAISKSGYSFSGTTLVVNADKTPTYSMTVVSVTAPSDPDQSTGYGVCYDHQGAVESGVTVTAELLSGPGSAGYCYDSASWTETSDANGLVQFVGMIQGATYRCRRGSGSWVNVIVPATQTFEIRELLGSP